MDHSSEKAPAREKDIQTIERELAERGYVAVEVPPFKGSVEYEGQAVKVPVAHAEGEKALICRNFEDKWECVKHGNEEEFETVLREVHSAVFNQ